MTDSLTQTAITAEITIDIAVTPASMPMQCLPLPRLPESITDIGRIRLGAGFRLAPQVRV